MSATERRNRRANTSSLPVRDNRIFGITVFRDGYVQRTITAYYRRHRVIGAPYTGVAPIPDAPRAA